MRASIVCLFAGVLPLSDASAQQTTFAPAQSIPSELTTMNVEPPEWLEDEALDLWNGGYSWRECMDLDPIVHERKWSEWDVCTALSDHFGLRWPAQATGPLELRPER